MPSNPRVPMQNADTAKQLTVTQQSQEEVARVKEQLAFQVEQVKREAEMKVRWCGPESSPAGLAPSPSQPGKHGGCAQFGCKGQGWLLVSVPDPGRSCPGSSGGCYLMRASFPLAQICHFFLQENATMQIDGFGCFCSLGPKLGAAPEIPALG